MRLLGFNITRQKHVLPASVDDRTWFPIIRESFTGAWQRGITVDREQVIAYHAVYACLTLIASDIAKLRVKLIGRDPDGIWIETTNPAYDPVLRKPNRYQTRIQFWENWELSKLMHGNTYVLKERDNRKVVVALYVLDPTRTRPVVTEDGAVYYQLSADNLAGLPDAMLVPASEIIHDRMNCLFHPLCGVSPIYASGLAATQGLKIQRNSAWFFGNNSMPGAILTAPAKIGPEAAERLKNEWQNGFTGENVGKVAVLGDGLKYESLPLSAREAQMIEQQKWTAEVVCSTFHVPPYKIGIGQMPTYNNIQALNVEYYSQCLQKLIEDAELCLDEGLGLGSDIGVEFDLDGLLRMDSVTQMEVIDKGVKAGVFAPNDGRARWGLPPAEGGESPYLQEQNYSLAALAKRDALADPFGREQPASGGQSEPEVIPPDESRMLSPARVKAMFTRAA